jgi:hypothetical protein
MPTGSAASRYYPSERMTARVNRDGEFAPAFMNGLQATEPYTDSNANGKRDPGEPYTDVDGNGQWDLGNPVPYALADMQNACMRYPDELAKHTARVAADQDREDTPTMRLLLDRMIAEPDRYHNAIFINLHGELLPMPPVRNYSDAAKDPAGHPGWRAVAHPERIRMVRVAGNDVSSTRPRWRVHAYKTSFPAVGNEVLTTQTEPFLDTNGNGAFDVGEVYQDWNGNGRRDAGVPITVTIPGGDFSVNVNNVNGAGLIPMTVSFLPGGIDADGSGAADAYAAFSQARQYPEKFTDANADGRRQVAEPFLDLNGDGLWLAGTEPYQNLDGDGTRTVASEPLTDQNGNNLYDSANPAEPFTDANANGRWDAAEPYWDKNLDGLRNGPTTPVLPWRAWNPAIDNVTPAAQNAYVAAYGEPYLDVNASGTWNGAETFFDCNQNGCWDGGFRRGEMWFQPSFDGARKQTTVTLWNTPLEAPFIAGTNTGIDPQWRLYDLDYIPCPTPTSAAALNRFGRDLFTSGSFPKNTARWIIEMSVPGLRKAYESGPGANDGDVVDRILEVDTRIGSDVTTGTMWPVANQPSNLCKAYAWYCDNIADVPFSERYQFQGDPRHCPYADTDATGASFPHGYNWFFDNFQNAGVNATTAWLAFDTTRIKDAWLTNRGSAHDVGRILYWLRTAIAKTEAVYTTLTGWSYYYLSLGGDVGYDSANGFANSIPMDGTPFGLGGDVNECTIIDAIGTAAITGSSKYVASNNGTAANGIRTGGVWFSKPWIGELYEDAAYQGQWAPWGNLRAATGTSAQQYHLIRRGDTPAVQQPRGTTLVNAYARLAAEGCTSVFNIGTTASSFHHTGANGQTGVLVEDGPQLAQNYNFPLPTSAGISRPWGLTLAGSGGVGDEFNYTTEYPRFTATMVRRFYDHQMGGSYTGSGLVRLREPGGARGAYVVVNGIDKTLESGSAFISRYSMLTLIHSFFAAGLPATPNRIKQLPRLQVRNPTLVTELEDPVTIPVRWSTEWRRWDGNQYTSNYPVVFAENEAELVYVLMYSADGGATWKNMRDESPAEPGVIPWINGVGPDPAKTLTDQNVNADETWNWPTPAGSFPEGTYLVRIESYRASESLHYSQHMEKIYVNR